MNSENYTYLQGHSLNLGKVIKRLCYRMTGVHISDLVFYKYDDFLYENLKEMRMEVFICLFILYLKSNKGFHKQLHDVDLKTDSIDFYMLNSLGVDSPIHALFYSGFTDIYIEKNVSVSIRRYLINMLIPNPSPTEFLIGMVTFRMNTFLYIIQHKDQTIVLKGSYLKDLNMDEDRMIHAVRIRNGILEVLNKKGNVLESRKMEGFRIRRFSGLRKRDN